MYVPVWRWCCSFLRVFPRMLSPLVLHIPYQTNTTPRTPPQAPHPNHTTPSIKYRKHTTPQEQHFSKDITSVCLTCKDLFMYGSILQYIIVFFLVFCTVHTLSCVLLPPCTRVQILIHFVSPTHVFYLLCIALLCAHVCVHRISCTRRV